MIDIRKKSDCSGCTACVSVCHRHAISFVKDEEGFSYPQVDKNMCVSCGRCVSVCPILFRDNSKEINRPLKVYAAHSRDEHNWVTSSSGGVFQIMANDIIRKGGIVCGAMYDADFKVVHYCTSDETELKKFQGSKYVQSDLNGVFVQIKKYLNENICVLFSGTPCQVEGLKCFLGKEYTNLLTCDLVCHSVPSPLVFSDYISYIQKKYHQKIVRINMKDKTLGWGKQSPRIHFDNGTDIFNNEDTILWNNLFYSQLITRPSCHKCRFANTSRAGDITIGDFWGIENVHPELYDKRGVSLIYINTTKGLHFFHIVADSMNLKESSLEDSFQENLRHPVLVNPRRDAFWKDYQVLSFDSVVDKYINNPTRLSLSKRIYKKILGIYKK